MDIDDAEPQACGIHDTQADRHMYLMIEVFEAIETSPRALITIQCYSTSATSELKTSQWD